MVMAGEKAAVSNGTLVLSVTVKVLMASVEGSDWSIDLVSKPATNKGWCMVSSFSMISHADG